MKITSQHIDQIISEFQVSSRDYLCNGSTTFQELWSNADCRRDIKEAGIKFLEQSLHYSTTYFQPPRPISANLFIEKYNDPDSRKLIRVVRLDFLNDLKENFEFYFPQKQNNKHMNTIYQVAAERDVEGILGYATGDPKNIRQYFANEKYTIYLKEIKIVPVTSDMAMGKEILLKEKKRLEERLKEINNQLQ